MTYNDLCDNGCPLPRYTARRVCKKCVAAESLARKRALQGEPMKQGRRKQQDGNVERQERIENTPLPGFNAFSNDWAKRSLRVSA